MRMTTPADTLERAAEAQRAGDVHRAEELYRQRLRAEPSNAAVWSALGRLCAGQGRLAEAVACLRQALELVPGDGGGHVQLGDVHLRQKKYAEAELAYR